MTMQPPRVLPRLKRNIGSPSRTAVGTASSGRAHSSRMVIALLLGKTLVLGLLLRRALGFPGYLLDPLLRVLGLLLGLLHEGVAGLAHHLVLLGGLGDRQPHGRPNPDVQVAHGQGVLPQNPLEPAASPRLIMYPIER